MSLCFFSLCVFGELTIIKGDSSLGLLAHRWWYVALIVVVGRLLLTVFVKYIYKKSQSHYKTGFSLF